MDFPKTLSIEASEKFLRDLDKRNCDDQLSLPVGTSGFAFGGLASSIQAINTWARSSQTRIIKLRSSNKKDVIDDLISKPHKFVAAMSARSIFKDENQDDSIKLEIYSKAKEAIENQARHPFGQQRGGLCWFVFVDHSSKGFDRNFYITRQNGNPEPRQPEQLKAIIKAMAQKAVSIPGGSKPPSEENLDHIGRIFYELFLNTHEHGTKKLQRNLWLKPGVRVIYAQGINLNDVATKKIIDQQPALSQYVQSVENKLKVQGNHRFLELSIIDSGLGYCKRWLADNSASYQDPDVIPLNDEYDLFKKCFQFRQTSTSQGNKGNGLPVVMEKLTKLNGLMRIRSGRISVFRDFVKSPYTDNDVCRFFDWSSLKAEEKNISCMPEVTGVAISLLIPLEAKS